MFSILFGITDEGKASRAYASFGFLGVQNDYLRANYTILDDVKCSLYIDI